MVNPKTANKERSFGLYGLAIKRIGECGGRKEIIPFPVIFEKLCRSFSITKKEAWELLYLFREFEIIKIVCGHGVVILK